MKYFFSSMILLLILDACTVSNNEIESYVSRVKTKDVVVNEKQFFSVKTPKTCSLQDQNKFVYDVMHDSYLWSKNVPSQKYLVSSSASPKETLQSLKCKDDHFSYIMDLTKVDTFFGKGKYNNFGFIPFLIEYEEYGLAFVVAFVYPNSPAKNAGLKRGDIITKVNGNLIIQENLASIYSTLKKMKGVNFTWIRNTKSYNKYIYKHQYTVRTVTQSHIYNIGDKKVGYMVLSDFIEMSKYEIDSIFRRFKKANISELILDLRYNGGGDVRIANHLASLIGGANVMNKVSEHMFFNKKYSNLNKTSFFEAYNQNQLDLDRLFVITSERTCSASERVIHNLQASHTGMKIVQIGKKTCGKPYGYEGVGIFCNKVLFAINTESTNGDKKGHYVEGLVPTCEADDDMFIALGDKEETSLKEAIYYIKNNKCSTSKNVSSEYKIMDFITEYLGL
jgi:C-terminal processing protease CtpA/Prc